MEPWKKPWFVFLFRACAVCTAPRSRCLVRCSNDNEDMDVSFRLVLLNDSRSQLFCRTFQEFHPVYAKNFSFSR